MELDLVCDMKKDVFSVALEDDRLCQLFRVRKLQKPGEKDVIDESKKKELEECRECVVFPGNPVLCLLNSKNNFQTKGFQGMCPVCS
ncbi:hypothetical protein llap_5489 [Limosa lapponica baueri]|uniref:Uncharacterized protein n=1 Tax=Limosa lapponica baueri TaxID=1758121 RepID=A0A2I0UDW0_LIMLA|nr:hypothetical protein llap_5489 [Limosa lapponica baueri]